MAAVWNPVHFSDKLFSWNFSQAWDFAIYFMWKYCGKWNATLLPSSSQLSVQWSIVHLLHLIIVGSFKGMIALSGKGFSTNYSWKHDCFNPNWFFNTTLQNVAVYKCTVIKYFCEHSLWEIHIILINEKDLFVNIQLQTISFQNVIHFGIVYLRNTYTVTIL